MLRNYQMSSNKENACLGLHLQRRKINPTDLTLRDFSVSRITMTGPRRAPCLLLLSNEVSERSLVVLPTFSLRIDNFYSSFEAVCPQHQYLRIFSEPCTHFYLILRQHLTACLGDRYHLPIGDRLRRASSERHLSLSGKNTATRT